MPSSPSVLIPTLACSLTLGLAWKATPSPASLSMGMSLAPSPTAITCFSDKPSFLAISCSSSALRLPSTISPLTCPVSLPS